MIQQRCIALLVVVVSMIGSVLAWPRTDLDAYGYKRARGYDFGLGKRSMEDPSGPSYDEASELLYPSSAMDNTENYDKRALYSFGLGKRARAYGFGLGKRLEHVWKANAAAMLPSYRQERRSKIYSFGLGKRSNGADFDMDDYYNENPMELAALAADHEKRAKQFNFGLGKREAEPSSSHQANPSHLNNQQNTTS